MFAGCGKWYLYVTLKENTIFNLQICNVDRKRGKSKTSTRPRPFRRVEKVKLVSYTVAKGNDILCVVGKRS